MESDWCNCEHLVGRSATSSIALPLYCTEDGTHQRSLILRDRHEEQDGRGPSAASKSNKSTRASGRAASATSKESPKTMLKDSYDKKT